MQLVRNRNFWLMLLGDCLLVVGVYYLAYVMRFEGAVPKPHLQVFYKTVGWILPLKLAVFFAFDMYKGMWRYFGLHDLLNVVKACAVVFAVTVVVILGLDRFDGYSRSVFVIDGVLWLLSAGSLRLLIRVIHTPLLPAVIFGKKKRTPFERYLIIGAGSAGEQLLREIRHNPALAYDVVGFIDDMPAKLRKTLHGVPVLGALKDLERIVRQHRVEQIIIATPSATAAQIRSIVDSCKNVGVPYRTLPGLGDLIDGRAAVSSIREVRYEDLLGREAVHLEHDLIGDYLTGRNVLVTGGAGSIGSELCRQIARFKPARLILVEQNESGLYDIDLQLRADFPGLRTAPVLARIQARERMEHVFERYKPRVVFHAAAYKHVPMMELNPSEAVFNNIVGSQVIMALCHEHHLDRCVIVSTDKAVRPTNVMGASKRVTELLAQCFAARSSVKFMAVRFGNVVGSAGSVIPLFKRQIARGGPVTVTHPQVTRYFMTIPEASSLILQAGALGEGGELFVLKMGTPIRIANLARDLITLSGLQPDVDIEIQHTGLRPGEKLYEELITADEGIQVTRHKDIMVLKSACCPSPALLTAQIRDLADLAHAQDAAGIRKKLGEIVPEYCPAPADGLPAPIVPAALPEKQADLGGRSAAVIPFVENYRVLSAADRGPSEREVARGRSRASIS